MFFSPTIIIKLQDGLGNQLFQYAHGVALATRLGVPVRFDDRFFHTKEHRAQVTPRRYAMDFFAAHVPVVESSVAHRLESVNPWKWLNGKNQRRVAAGKRPIGAVLLWDSWNWRDRMEFDAVGAELRQRLAFRLPEAQLSSPAQATLAKIRAVKNPVMLHVRRGDYIGNSLHDVCAPAFYRSALERVLADVAGAQLIVFSEDIAWCREHFSDLAPSAWFHEPGDEREDFRLMAQCRHHILPNSTFSWWAAWLAKSPGQRVYCPDRWYTDPARSDKAMRDLVYDGWVRIGSR